MVGIGGVKIVHAALNGAAHHFGSSLLVNLTVGSLGQTHGAKAQQGQLFSMKIIVKHERHPFSAPRTRYDMFTFSVTDRCVRSRTFLQKEGWLL